MKDKSQDAIEGLSAPNTNSSKVEALACANDFVHLSRLDEMSKKLEREAFSEFVRALAFASRKYRQHSDAKMPMPHLTSITPFPLYRSLPSKPVSMIPTRCVPRCCTTP